MKCPHRYVLYDREWWICSSCDDYYREKPGMTNAWKAVLIGVINGVIQFSESFGIYDFSDQQEAAVIGLFNSIAVAYVLLTYKNSPKRIPE